MAFQDISFALVSQDRQVKNQIFHSQGEKIYCMFEDNTNFLLGIGMMIPNAIKIDEIKFVPSPIGPKRQKVAPERATF